MQLEHNGKSADSEGSHDMTSTYDMELQALQEIVQQKVIYLAFYLSLNLALFYIN